MANGLFGTGTQVPTINQPRVQPAAIPGSTYVRPQERQVGGNAAALADALGGLNSSLQNYANMRHAQENDPNSLDNKEWIARRQQMTFDDLRREAEQGTADGNRIRTDALNLLLADRGAEEYRQWALEYYNTDFDRSSGDFSADSLSKMEEIAEGLPEVARGSFFEKTRPFAQKWAETDIKDKTEYLRGEINTSVVSGFRNTIDSILMDGKGTPEEAASAIFEQSAQNRTFLGLSGTEQNATIFSVAQEYAQQGNTAMVEALLNGTRTGADGSKVPALSTTAKYSTKSVELIDQSRNFNRKRNKEDGLDIMTNVSDSVLRGEFTKADAKELTDFYTTDQLTTMVARSEQNRQRIREKAATDEQKASLLQHAEREEAKVIFNARAELTKFGGITQIHDVEVPTKTGGTRTMSADQIIKLAVRDQEEHFRDRERKLIEVEGMSARDAAQQIDSERMAWYSGNKIKNSTWTTHFNALPSMATPETMENENTRQNFIDHANRYRDLKAQNFAYAESLVTDGTAREFLEIYDQGMTLHGMDEESALTFATTQIARPEGEKGRTKFEPQKVEKMTDKALKSRNFDRQGPNYGIVQHKIDQLTQLSLSPDIVQERLDEWLDKATVNINGTIVPDHQDLPEDFGPLMERHLMTVFEERGEEFGLESADELTVVPVSGENRWMVFHKDNGLPIGYTPITPQSLQNVRKEVEAEAEAELAELHAATEERRQAARDKFDAFVQSRQDFIDRWSTSSTTFGQHIAEKAQRQLDDYIRRADPKIMRQERKEREKQRKKQGEELRDKLGFDDKVMKERFGGPKNR